MSWATRALCRPRKTGPWWSACCLALSSSTYHSFYDLLLLIFLFLQPMANFNNCEIKDPGVWGQRGSLRSSSQACSLNSGGKRLRGWGLPKLRGGARVESVGSAHKLPPPYTEMLPTSEPCKPQLQAPQGPGSEDRESWSCLSQASVFSSVQWAMSPPAVRRQPCPFPSLFHIPLTVPFQPNSVYFIPVCSVHFSPLPIPACSIGLG